MYEEKLRHFGWQIADQPWQQNVFYQAFLAQTYMYVQHTLKLLALSAAYFPKEDVPMINRFLSHAVEEKGHDQLLILDLKALGVDPSTIEETPATAAFYQVQYYKIQHVSPYAIFGWILMLEGLVATCGEAVYKNCLQAHGEACTHFLRVHVKEDPEHFRKAAGLTSTLPPSEQRHIEQGFDQALYMYAKILEGCCVP